MDEIYKNMRALKIRAAEVMDKLLPFDLNRILPSGEEIEHNLGAAQELIKILDEMADLHFNADAGEREEVSKVRWAHIQSED